MPRSLDPSSRLTMVLACDLDKPKETQPRIFAKTPNLNQQGKLLGTLESLKKGGITEQIDAIIDAAMICLTGWENIPVEFSREAIGEVLDLGEVIEVITHLATISTPTADDKKKSE